MSKNTVRHVTDSDVLSKIEACAKRVKMLEAQCESARESYKSIKQDLEDATSELVILGAGGDTPLIDGKCVGE